MKVTIALLVLSLSIPAAAADVEQILLPVSPSIVHCGYDSRYETRLVAFNDDGTRAGRVCAGGACRALEPMQQTEFAGEFAGGTPMPSWIYLPKEIADSMALSLVVESSNRLRPEERSFTEIPVVRAREFRSGKMQFIGVRMDPDFRQTVRIYGLDGNQYAHLMMRVYDFATAELLHECPHMLSPIGEGRPSFGMECDMSEHIPADGRKVRIELEPLNEGLKYWAFLSITNNVTQHFYTVLPR